MDRSNINYELYSSVKSELSTILKSVGNPNTDAKCVIIIFTYKNEMDAVCYKNDRATFKAAMGPINEKSNELGIYYLDYMFKDGNLDICPIKREYVSDILLDIGGEELENLYFNNKVFIDETSLNPNKIMLRVEELLNKYYYDNYKIIEIKMSKPQYIS